MSVVGMLSGDAGEPDDGVGIDADQASGGADTASLVEVLEHGEGLLFGKMDVEKGRAFAFGETLLAGVTVEQADVVSFAVASADGEIAEVTLRVERTVGVLTTEASEIVHGKNRAQVQIGSGINGFKPNVAPFLRGFPTHCSLILRHDRPLNCNTTRCFDLSVHSLSDSSGAGSGLRSPFRLATETAPQTRIACRPEMRNANTQGRQQTLEVWHTMIRSPSRILRWYA